MANEKRQIEMHFPPEFVLQYGRKLLAAAKGGKNNGPAEIAMLTDIVTMLEIATGAMEPSQPDAGNSIKPSKNETE